MKIFILSLAILFCSLSSWAEGVNALLLHLASGKQVACLLDEQPVVTLRGDELVVTTHMNEVSYQSADVLKFTYLYVEPSGVRQLPMQSMFTFGGNTLSIVGAEPGSQIAVYSVDGVLMASAKAGNKGSASLSLPEQKGKVYVVKTSVANFKITKP